MNEVWNLDPIYKGFDDPAFEQDVALAKQTIDAYIAFMGKLSEMDPAQALREGIALEEQISELTHDEIAYCTKVDSVRAIRRLFSVFHR